MRDYAGGILDDDNASTSPNHVVSITGYGKDPETGKDYWIVRNSVSMIMLNDVLSILVSVLFHLTLPPCLYFCSYTSVGR